MARGQQKVQSQQKNAEKKAKQKKSGSQLKAAEKALVFSCSVCLVNDISSLQQFKKWQIFCLYC